MITPADTVRPKLVQGLPDPPPITQQDIEEARRDEREWREHMRLVKERMEVSR